MTHDNGLRSLAVGILITIAIALSGWALAKSVEHESCISRLQAQQEGTREIISRVEAKLDSLDSKLDRLIERGATH